MKKILLPTAVLLLLGGCIGDDIIFDTVPESLRITNPLDTLGVGESHTFVLLFTNNVGIEESRQASWKSSDPDVLEVDDTGKVTALSKGDATVTARVDLPAGRFVEANTSIVVDEETVPGNPGNNTRKGVIRTTSSYVLRGNFVVRKEGDNLIIDIADDYEATRALPGLYVYLSNNPNTTQGALEIGAVEVFKGAHKYTLGGNIPLNQYNYLLYYCKPFNVKVGDGRIED